MSAQYHNGHWYGGGQDIDIQSDPTATSFDPNKVPTGATAQSILNSKLISFAKFKRVELELSLAANSDVNITKNDIATAANITSSKIYVVLPEGVRPKTTWNCKPSGIFYHSTYDRWGVHNNSATADSIIVDFIIFYIE